MAKRAVGLALCVVFLAGIVLQAAGAYAEEKSRLYNDVKKFFHYSDEYPDSPKAKDTPGHTWKNLGEERPSPFFNMLGDMIRGPHEKRAAAGK